MCVFGNHIHPIKYIAQSTKETDCLIRSTSKGLFGQASQKCLCSRYFAKALLREAVNWSFPQTELWGSYLASVNAKTQRPPKPVSKISWCVLCCRKSNRPTAWPNRPLEWPYQHALACYDSQISDFKVNYETLISLMGKARIIYLGNLKSNQKQV